MIQLLNLKGMFRGTTGDDANQHLMNFVAICKSQEIPGEAFLERFYPESKELQMKDEIGAHKQLPGEAMHDTWWRFSKKLNNLWWIIQGKPFPEIIQLMDEVSKNNRAWHTRDAEVGDLGFTFDLSPEQKRREEERDHDMAHMRTQMDLLTKHIMAGRNYSREGQYDRLANREQGDLQIRDSYRNDRNGVYVPPGVKEMKADFSSMSQLVDSHTTSIKKIEQQLGHLLASLNQRKNGALPSDTIPNLKKDGHCMAITTISGKVIYEKKYTSTKKGNDEADVEVEQFDDIEEAQPTVKPVERK
ncbi:hypothetical protein KY285_021933 [Solanum tuberosum]|nr:hypothetical protein KY284_022621 [Solanum tuberosum]KAH0694836.1 hypothetical protein KY285_021933 [Solanum tuberosum]